MFHIKYNNIVSTFIILALCASFEFYEPLTRTKTKYLVIMINATGGGAYRTWPYIERRPYKMYKFVDI